MQHIPFMHYKEHIAINLIDAGIFNAEWFNTQSKRIAIYYNAGETTDGAIEMITIFAKANNCKNSTKEVSRARLESAGCTFN